MQLESVRRAKCIADVFATSCVRPVACIRQARGSCGKGGHDYFVDNVKELLDVPTGAHEFYEEE